MTDQTPNSPKPSPRGSGAGDLDVWSRSVTGSQGEVPGSAGNFSNPDTSGWIPFRPDPADVKGESAFDASRYVDAPSGKHGFLKPTPEGTFVFEDGTPVKFLGGQADVFPEKDYAAWHVQWMRRHGMNFLRGHGFGIPDAERWDKLDFFINECRKGGVYLILTPIYWTKMKVIDPNGEEIETTSHVVLFFDENIEQAAREIWRGFYQHENPYTGLRYCDDPTLMAFELKNEDSAFWALSWVKNDAPQYWKKMLRQYAEFLKESYGSTEDLRAAWTDADGDCALGEGESLEEANIDLLEMGSWWDYKNPEVARGPKRKSDQMRFLHRKQREFYDRSYRYLRELGCKQAICGSNWRGHSYTNRLVLECDSRMDYTDQHDYWDHPQGGWTTATAVFHNKSMLKAAGGGLVGNLAPRRVLGVPYIMTEWNIGSWNEHVQEAAFSMISVGCIQGWAGLLQFTLTPRNWFEGKSYLDDRFFNVADHPSVALQYPTLSRIWHRGDIREAEPVFVRRISPENRYTPGEIDTKYMPYAFMVGAPEMEPEPGQYGYLVPVVGKVANEFVEKPSGHLCREDVIEKHLDQTGKVARSMTGEFTWDWGHGYCLIDSPKTQAVCGYIGGARMKAAEVVFETDVPYGVIMVTTLDDDSPIADSRNLLVTALGRCRNTGTVYGRPNIPETGEQAPHSHQIRLPEDQRVAILEMGDEPVRSQPVTGCLRLKVKDPAGAQVWLLDHAGRRLDPIDASVEGDRLVLPLPGEHKAFFCQIVC